MYSGCASVNKSSGRFEGVTVAFVVWGDTYKLRDVLAGRAPDLVDVPRARFWRSTDIMRVFRDSKITLTREEQSNVVVTGWFHFMGGTIVSDNPDEMLGVFGALYRYASQRTPVDLQEVPISEDVLVAFGLLWPPSEDNGALTSVV